MAITHRARSVARKDERGFVIVYTALLLVVLMAAAAFAVDLGSWYMRSNQIQRAADAAALAGVVWMPNDFATAKQVALSTAKANGFADGVNGITVTVTPDVNSTQRLDVTINDNNVTQYFSKLFLPKVTEHRLSVADYELPVPLGSPENSFGTGTLTCGTGAAPNGTCVGQPANVWLAVSGFCAPREQGDLRSSFYDANRSAAGGSTYCATPGTTSPPSPTYASPTYRSTGYFYDFDLPGNTAQPPVTTQNVTFEIFDPAYNCNSLAFDSSSGSTSCAGTDTNWVLQAPGSNALDYTTYPVIASGTFTNGSAACKNNWCAIQSVISGSTAGRYRLNIYTTANQAGAQGTNQFALRAKMGDVVGFSNSATPTPVVDLLPFTSCTTIVGAVGYNVNCPHVHGEDAMSLYVSGAATTVGCHLAGTNATACAIFYLAQVQSAYAGRTFRISLFDPGEGAQAIQLLQPDGSLASFTYMTNDSTIEGPSGPAPFYSSDGLNPPVAKVKCLCDVGSTTSQLPGITSGSKYNDRLLQLDTVIPTGTAGTANGGWYKVEYDFSNGSVTDRTTWSASVLFSPVHLVQ